MEAIPRGGKRAEQLLTIVTEHAFLLAVTLISVFPLYVMLVASFQRASDFSESSLLPNLHPTLRNYATVWKDLGFNRMFFNSTVLSLSSATLATLLGACAAYAFTRFRFAGRVYLLAGVIGMMAVPAIVVIIPVFLLMSDLGFVNTYGSGIVTELGLLLPFTIFLLYSYLKDQPDELFDAADVDGASKFRQFWEIALPLARPALATTMIVSAIFAWNDLLVPLVLWQTDQLVTLMVGLAGLGGGRTGTLNVPLLMAGVTISIAPLVAVFVVARRALVRGLVEGSDR